MSVKGVFVEIPQFERPYIYPFGFRGIFVEYPTTARFIKITDFRGNPILNALITVKNSGGDYIQTTDELGIAAVEIDLLGTVEVYIVKDKTFKTEYFTSSTDPLTKTYILQPRLLE